MTVSDVMTITMGTPDLLQDIVAGYATDSLTQHLLAQLQRADSKVKHLVMDGTILRYKGRVWVGGNVEMHHKILQTLHSGAIGRHSRVHATLQRVRQLFAWPCMKASVQQFIEQCAVCKQAKPEHVKYPGLLKPLSVPDAA
jgi:hypothetical protein